MSLEKDNNIIWILESDRGQQLKYQQLLEAVSKIRFFDSLMEFKNFFYKID